MRSLASIATEIASPPSARPGLPVAKVSTKSPLEFSPEPPVRPTPSAARWARRSHWCGSRGASVATRTMMDPPVGGRGGSAMRSGPSARPTATPFTWRRLRRPWFACTSTATVCPSATPADVPFANGAVSGGVEGLEDVFRLDVEPVDVVQETVPGLAHDGQRPVPLSLRGGAQRVADDSEAVRVRETDRRRQEAGFLDPREA